MDEIFSLAFSGYDIGHLYRHLMVCFGLFILTMVACCIDFISGTWTAKILKEPLRSRKFRMTIEKIAWYWLIQLLGFLFGIMGTVFSWYEWPYISMVIAAAILLIEGRSVMEHSKRRKCRTAKIPESIRDMAEWIGEAELKKSIKDLARKRVIEALGRGMGDDVHLPSSDASDSTDCHSADCGCADCGCADCGCASE